MHWPSFISFIISYAADPNDHAGYGLSLTRIAVSNPAGVTMLPYIRRRSASTEPSLRR